jgi:TolA-binding protein
VKDRKQARMLIGIIQNFDRRYAEAESILKEALAIRPVSEYDSKMMFVLARLYVAWNKKDAAQGTLRALLKDHGDSSVAAKARDLLASLERDRR